jgi:hypothetical protein
MRISSHESAPNAGGRVSLSIELPAAAEAGGTGISSAVLADTISRLQLVTQAAHLPVTWIWNGTPPTGTTELNALASISEGDLGWWAPQNVASRTAYRAQYLGWLKQWNKAQKQIGKPLRMLVNSGNKVAIPYDAVLASGITILRDTQVMQRDPRHPFAPRVLTNGLWQMPLTGTHLLGAGWLSSTRGIWGLQGTLKQLIRQPQGNIHLRIDAHSQQELGNTALANWERLIQAVAGFQAQGIRVQMAADTLARESQHQRGISILRAA